MKDGIFVIYKNKEYTAGKKRGSNITLISENEDDVKDGFQFRKGYKNNVYTKEVPILEVSEKYAITTYVVYKGYDFIVINEEGNKIFIQSTNTNEIKEDLELTELSPGLYGTWVDISKVDEIYEDKKILDI